MTNGLDSWWREAPRLVKTVPFLIAIFSGSAGGAVTVAALRAEPLSVNEIIKTETRLLAALEGQSKELGRIYGAIGSLDDRQRAMTTAITRLEVVTSNLQRNHDAAH